jgi:hypothetical protein
MRLLSTSTLFYSVLAAACHWRSSSRWHTAPARLQLGFFQWQSNAPWTCAWLAVRKPDCIMSRAVTSGVFDRCHVDSTRACSTPSASSNHWARGSRTIHRTPLIQQYFNVSHCEVAEGAEHTASAAGSAEQQQQQQHCRSCCWLPCTTHWAYMRP